MVFDSRGEPRDDGDELDTGAAVEELGRERRCLDPERKGEEWRGQVAMIIVAWS